MDADSKGLTGDRTERDARVVSERYHGQGGEGNEAHATRSSGLADAEHRNASAEQRERRRSDLIERAIAGAMDRALAELLYDIALEEGLDPPLALELVRTGLSVAPPSEDRSPDDPVADRYVPTWILSDEDPHHFGRERALRMTFRRFRALLESEEDLEVAFRKLTAEPDVGYFGY